jgi:hypothetical protein
MKNNDELRTKIAELEKTLKYFIDMHIKDSVRYGREIEIKDALLQFQVDNDLMVNKVKSRCKE